MVCQEKGQRGRQRLVPSQHDHPFRGKSWDYLFNRFNLAGSSKEHIIYYGGTKASVVGSQNSTTPFWGDHKIVWIWGDHKNPLSVVWKFQFFAPSVQILLHLTINFFTPLSQLKGTDLKSGCGQNHSVGIPIRHALPMYDAVALYMIKKFNS